MLSSKLVKTLQMAALLAVSATAYGAEDHVVLDTMSGELLRNYRIVRRDDDRVFYTPR